MTDTPDDTEPDAELTAPAETNAPGGFSKGDVRLIPLDRIDLDDTRFRFRATLRVGSLAKSIKADGLHVPIIVRSHGKGRGTRYQIISGFRRTTAVRELGFAAIPAVVRDDLEDDEEAFRASVLENTQRKTWSDIDRALVIRSYDERGHTGRETAEVLGLTDRQARNIRSLLELPEEAQRAVDEEGDKVTATHAIVLRQLAGRYPELEWGRWLGEINTGKSGEGLSVARLKREVNRAYATGERTGLGSIFRDGATDAAKGVFRLQPVRIEVGVLSEGERAELRAQLEMMLGALAVG